jgi:tetratricopeptide (TPR) repeat protein
MSIPLRILAGIACAAALQLAGAEPLLKPLPVPDLAGLPPQVAKRLTDDRAAFDKLQPTLIGPQLAQAYADIGVDYAQAGLKELAATALYDAWQADPKDARWLYLRGLVEHDLKRNAEARAAFEAALALDQVYLPIAMRLAETQVELGDDDAARRVLEGAVRAHPEQPAPLAALGQLSLKQKRYPDAVANLLAALKLAPQANQLYRPLAEAYAGMGNAKGAEDARSKAGDVAPQLGDPLGLSLAKPAQPSGTPLEQARRLAATGKLDAARALIAQQLREHPDDAATLALQAQIEASDGNAVGAAAAADHALKVARDDANVLLARGVVYEYAGNEDQAYAFYQRAARADPKLADAHLLLGNTEMRRGNHAAAAEQYRQLVALHPADVQAQARLVAADVALKQCGRALKDLAAAQERLPKNGELMQVFVRLTSTCAAAKAEERDMALDYAKALYEQRADAGDTSALALALAAHGKFTEAQQYQAEAIFKFISSGDADGAALYRTVQASFAANKVPDLPWPAGHPYFKPPLLAARLAKTAPAKTPAK